MANEGANIVICDINEKTLPDATKEIEAVGRKCLGVRCDVSSSESVSQMFEQIVKQFGTLHILVNNAALVQNRPNEEERRTRFYEYLTTPMPRQSLHLRKISPTKSDTASGASTSTAFSTARARLSSSWKNRSTARLSILD